jgi:hypothetical protein
MIGKMWLVRRSRERQTAKRGLRERRANGFWAKRGL